MELAEQLKSNLVTKAVKNVQRGSKKEEIEGTMFRPEVTLDLQRSRLMTESFKKTDGQAMVLRRARALAHVLENMKVFIRDWERIVGYQTEDPNGLYHPIDLNWKSVKRLVDSEAGKTLLDDDGRKGQVSGPTPEEAAANLSPLPEGTDTTAPKPAVGGKTDFEKQTQLYGYLCEICGIDQKEVFTSGRILSADEKVRLSAELEALTEFENGGEKIAGEKSLRDLKGKRLNVALGKAKAKLGHSTAKDELLHLLDCPALSQEIADEYRKEADDKRHKDQWFKDQIVIVNGLITDAEKEADKQETLL